MAVKNFRELLALASDFLGVSEQKNIESFIQIAEGVETVLIEASSGIKLALSSMPELRVDRAFLFCDFGKVPKKQEALILRKLLEINFSLYFGNSPCFLRNPETGHIVLGCEILFEHIDQTSLKDLIDNVTHQAILWKENYFLS